MYKLGSSYLCEIHSRNLQYTSASEDKKPIGMHGTHMNEVCDVT